MSRHDDAARALMQARDAKQRLALLPEACRPTDVPGAYAIQAAHRALMTKGGFGKQIGWKIGCTNEKAQEHLGINEPFYGGMFAGTARRTPARYAADGFFMTVIEAEIAFCMKEPLPAAAAPYDPGSVADAVDYVMPSLEIVDSRYESWTTIGAPHIIADNGSHGAWVSGEPVRNWGEIDLADLDVTLFADGVQVREGNGFAVMGNPLNALTWLANVRAVYAGEGLQAGDVITTGTTIDVYDARRGEHLMADYGPLGQIELYID